MPEDIRTVSTPPENAQAETPPSMAALVQGIVNDAQALIRQELTLARTEIKKDWQDLREAGAAFGVGGVMALMASIFLGFMFVYLLNEVVSIQPLWVCFLIVGGLLGVAAAVFLLRGWQKASSIELGPEQTVESIKEIV